MAVYKRRRGSRNELGEPAHEQWRRPRCLKDPLSKYFLKLSANPQVPLLDSVLPLRSLLLTTQAAPGCVVR